MNENSIVVSVVSLLVSLISAGTSIITVIISNKSRKETVKSALEAESNWREHLLDVASNANIDINDLLRLRASQRYKKSDKSLVDVSTFDRDKEKAANILWVETNKLYKEYVIDGSTGSTAIIKEDQIKIRDLAIALLKFDYLNRDVKGYNPEAYTEFLNWLIHEKEWVDTLNKNNS